LRLVGGAISIHSTSRGTTIEASVPLAGPDIPAAEIVLRGLGKMSYLPPLNVNA
jgi:ribosomal protein L19